MIEPASNRRHSDTIFLKMNSRIVLTTLRAGGYIKENAGARNQRDTMRFKQMCPRFNYRVRWWYLEVFPQEQRSGNRLASPLHAKDHRQ